MPFPSRIVAAIAFASACVPSLAAAAMIPIDPSLFTAINPAGIGSWSGNSLTIDFTQQTSGGFVQTGLIDPAVLPAGVSGISFTATSTLLHPRARFGWSVYDSAGYGHGIKYLDTYSAVAGSGWTLGTWNVTTNDTGAETSVFVGSNYSPLDLSNSFLHSYPFIGLDFRADGYDGTTYQPGSFTFNDIQWIVPDPPNSVPAPPAGLLFVTAAIGLLVTRVGCRAHAAQRTRA